MVVIWTIHDFPTYDLTSSGSIKGKLACTRCAKKTAHRILHHSSKIYYMRHRLFLPLGHKRRFQKSQFNGMIEKKATPKRSSGKQGLNELESLRPIIFGKTGKKQVILGFEKHKN